jgi:hypothetical protein
MFCVPGHVFGGSEGVGSRFQVLRSLKRLNSFSAVPRSSGPIFMFCTLGHVFDGVEGVGSRFQVLRSRTRFRQCGGRRVLFSCFARPDTFSAVRRASGPVFMFCAPGLVFGGSEGVGSHFYVLRSRTRFRRYRRCRFPLSCFRSRTRFRRCGGCRVPF